METQAIGQIDAYRRQVGRGRQLRSSWPEDTYRWVPSLAVAEELAVKLRELAGVGENEALTDFGPLLEAGSFDLGLADLQAEAGGHEAVMVPHPGGGFTIRVDPCPRGGWGAADPNLRETTAAARTRFRAAHEIAHSFFYKSTARGPTRLRRSTPAEESFCDHLASSLLVPPGIARTRACSAASVVDLHSCFEVSVELAARALATAHPAAEVVLGYRPAPGAPIKTQWSTLTQTQAWAELEAGAPDDTWSRAELPAPRHQVVLVRACAAGAQSCSASALPSCR